MKKNLNLCNKTVTIYYNETYKNKRIPVIILNTYDENSEEIWNDSKKISNEYILVSISNIDWNSEMSPWYMDRLYKNGEDYLGKADSYLLELTNTILKEVSLFINNNIKLEIKEFIIGGYSLAGLFALYSIYKTKIFTKIIACSGSFWYPNFIEYVKTNRIDNNPKKIYFSLGNKESKTKNSIMSKVEVNTRYLESYYKQIGIEAIFEENEGNHFQDVNSRIVKGIRWILNE